VEDAKSLLALITIPVMGRVPPRLQAFNFSNQLQSP